MKRPVDMKQGCGFVMFSNADDKQGAGLKYAYYPPEYNCGWIVKNGHMTVEQRGLLNDAFTKLTLVVKDKQLMQFRNGLLLAVTDTVNPSSQPLTFGGMQDPRRAPQRYEFRNIRVYDQAIFPAGFDRHADRMRHVSGDQYTLQRVEVKDPSLPRILVMGDSISMGYRNLITDHFKGRAYVDYWVFNKIVDEVMQREGVPEVDLYAIAEKQLHTVRKGSRGHGPLGNGRVASVRRSDHQGNRASPARQRAGPSEMNVGRWYHVQSFLNGYPKTDPPRTTALRGRRESSNPLR